jgi:hypothetical protein
MGVDGSRWEEFLPARSRLFIDGGVWVWVWVWAAESRRLTDPGRPMAGGSGRLTDEEACRVLGGTSLGRVKSPIGLASLRPLWTII